MKHSAFLNGVTLQEFFPLIAKLAQQIRMPVVVLSLNTTGAGKCTEVGIAHCATITIAPSGSVSEHTAKVDADLEMKGTSSTDFRAIYDGVSRAFSTSLVVGFSTAIYDVPVVYGNMVRYGLPIIAARNQLDLRDVWQQQVSEKGVLKTLAEHYKVEEGASHSKSGPAVTAARVLEAMLWRHGSDAVLRHLQHSLTSYLTPEQVTGAGDPLLALQSNTESLPAGKPVPRNSVSPGSVKAARRAQPKKADTWVGQLKKAISEAITQTGVIRPSHLKDIAHKLDWTEAKTSIEIGRLLTKGQIDAKPFIIPEQQALLNLHLPEAIKGMKEIRLMPIREKLLASTGHDIEYIQIRLGLKALGVRIE